MKELRKHDAADIISTARTVAAGCVVEAFIKKGIVWMWKSSIDGKTIADVVSRHKVVKAHEFENEHDAAIWFKKRSPGFNECHCWSGNTALELIKQGDAIRQRNKGYAQK